MKILSNQDIKVIEEATLKAQGITESELSERVGAAVAKEVKYLCEPEDEIVVLAGWGNNGADALVAARLLTMDGYHPKVYLFNLKARRISKNCIVARNLLRETPGATLIEVTGAEPFEWDNPTSRTTIIDGIFGSGLNKDMPRSFQIIAQNINQSGATVVSIDVPSGLFSEWNGKSPRQYMLHASLTIAVEFPRLAFMFGDNADVVGKWKVIRIGYDPSAVRQAPFSFVLTDKNLVSRFLRPRSEFSSKANYGNALIYAGQTGMMGAAILAARGALRAGAGKVTVHSAAEGNVILQTAVPSAMFIADTGKNFITKMPLPEKYNACAVGPGIGTSDQTAAALEKLAKTAAASSKRLVLDADALNIIASHPNILNYLPALSIITPHPGEFDRIFGESENEEERLQKAIRSSQDYSLIIVLKGRHTAVVRPDGKVMFNSSGTPAMATPGSGDVLTGVITGLMATGMESEIAAFVGVYVHGKAGELAEEEHGQFGVTAEDIADRIGMAIKHIMKD